MDLIGVNIEVCGGGGGGGFPIDYNGKDKGGGGDGVFGGGDGGGYGTFTDGNESQASDERSLNDSINVKLTNADGSTRTSIYNADGYYFDSYGLDDKVDFNYIQNENGDLEVLNWTIKESTAFAELPESGDIP